MKDIFSKRQVEIIRAAIRLIGSGGIQELTIKNLSKEIGIAESAIYRHFESKTMILNAVLTYLKVLMTSNYEKIRNAKKSPLAKIQDLLNYQLQSYARNPVIVVVLLSDGIYKNEKSLLEMVFSIMNTSKKMLVVLISEGQEKGNIRDDIAADDLASLVLGYTRFTVTQWHLSDFTTDLLAAGKTLWETLNKILVKQ